MIGQKSAGELSIMIQVGYASVAVYAGLVVLFLVSVELYGADIRFATVSLGGLVLSGRGLIWTVFLLFRLRAVNFASASFSEVRVHLDRARRLLRKEFIAQFILMPLFLACVFPVIYMMVQRVNIFERFETAAFRIVAGYILITALSVWIYRRYYFRKFDLFEERMNELEDLGEK